ncbi:Pleckstrin y domain-containing B member 2 [Clonorchis sinensis]|uniref:Pleckstrin y domain-containing B member 2 n=1 Tax=Clonorchis sinensis TaxID=79923 RepID=A0A8T1M065_CLOSI|nr:Pleckstrin y domain-containing B member 2 [Clonorchis sinensis]
MEANIIKAGSVQRLSTVLRRWKPAWLVVYSNGNVGYFESKDSYVPKSLIYLPKKCIRLLSTPTHQVPPAGLSKDCLFGYTTNDGEWCFCADSPDAAVAWRLALIEARSVGRALGVHIAPTATYGGYTDGSNYYQHSAYPETTVPLYCNSSHPAGIPSLPTVYRGCDGELVVPQQVVEHPDGSRTIVLGRGNEILCRCRRGHYCDCGYGLGDAALLGLAAGTMMWSPFLWAPFFWC